MLDTGTVIIALIAGLITLVVLRYMQARRPVSNYPPGPLGLPIVGSMLQFVSHRDYHKYFMELGEKYGSVFSYMIGYQNFVIVNGIDSIKEALVTKGSDIANRPDDFVVSLYNPDYLGIGDAHFSDIWFNQRHFAHKTLRGFGFGKTSFESKIMEEVEFLITSLKATQQKPTDVWNLITNCVSNIICSITFGKRYNHYEDSGFLKAMTFVRDYVTSRGSLILYLGQVLPFLRPLLWKQVKDLKNATSNLEKFLLGEIAKKEEKLDTMSEPGDFIESYLLEIKKDTEGKFNKQYLKYNIMDIFAAGTETTSTTLTWSVLYMMVHPDVQRKVQKELDEVVGREKLPSWANKSDLPYTEATLLEIQRISSLVPMVPHATTKPTTLAGYNLPARCDVWVNLWSVHHDPKIYPDPEKFDPNRFLTEDGQLKKQDSFMPFGAGCRVCMGESLAKLELFLFFSAMLHQFSLSIPGGSMTPSLEGDLGITIMPKPFEVVIQERS